MEPGVCCQQRSLCRKHRQSVFFYSMWKGCPISKLASASEFFPLVGSYLASFLGHTLYLLAFPAGFSVRLYACRHVQTSPVSQLLYCHSLLALSTWHPPLLMTQRLPPLSPMKKQQLVSVELSRDENPFTFQHNTSGRAVLTNLLWCPGCGANVQHMPGMPQLLACCLLPYGNIWPMYGYFPRQRGQQTRRNIMQKDL